MVVNFKLFKEPNLFLLNNKVININKFDKLLLIMKKYKTKNLVMQENLTNLLEKDNLEDLNNADPILNNSQNKNILISKKNKKVIKTILTHRGYAIVKKNFGFKDINRTKKELTVSPYVNENYAAKATPFPVYLESDKKLFLPKHYGFETFGDPDKIKDIAKGLDIDLEFVGELRKDQQEPILAFMKSCESGSLSSKSKGGIITVGCGQGKTVMGLYLIGALKKKTLIIVHKEFLINQWKERIEQFLPDARVGVIQSSKVEIRNKDIVIGMLQSISMREYPWETFDDFGFTIVDECFPHKTGIITDQGIKYIGDLYDKWKNKEDLPKILSYNQKLKSFEYKNLTYSWRKIREVLIKITMSNKTITCTPEHKILTINGYKEAKNLNIGDIILSKYDINNKNSTIAKALNYDQLQIIYGTYLGCGKIEFTKKYRTRLEIVHTEKQKDYCYWKGEMLGIKKFKYIKGDEYVENSYGFTTNIFDIKEEFINKNKLVPQWLIDKIDLMGIAIWYMDKGKLINSKVSLHGRFDHESFLRLIKLFNTYHLYPTLKVICKNTLYIKFNLEDSYKFIVLIDKYLHSSFRNIESQYKKKNYIWNSKFLDYGTLIINKLEYIKNKGYKKSKEPFVFDIEVEDYHNFVIGEKKKKNNIQYFDGPVVSNCHHIGAEVFSRALPKINSQYSLGLSATPKRKDGLSKVFHWFLGPTLFDSKKREGLLPIHVNIAIYNCLDPKYNKMEVTGFGKICMARMVNNICDYERRTELVLEILKRLYNDGKKVLILSDRRAHLKEIFEKVESRNIATIGYYIGGMKEKDLKKSEEKEILLGTYTMSSEGMDIPDLDAVIFASPRSDIVQSIGRILRKKHESNPICWDIVDNFSVFPNQYNKRKAYYRKMNYPINIYDINDNETETIEFITTQLNKAPKLDVKGKEKKMKEKNIVLESYEFIEEE